MKAVTIIAVFLLSALNVSIAGTKDDVTKVAKATLLGGLINDVKISGSTATITYGGNADTDWNGSSRGKSASICIAKVFQQVATIKKVVIIIGSYRATMTRAQASAFYGSFASDADFKANVTNGVAYNKPKLKEFEAKFVKM